MFHRLRSSMSVSNTVSNAHTKFLQNLKMRESLMRCHKRILWTSCAFLKQHVMMMNWSVSVKFLLIVVQNRERSLIRLVTTLQLLNGSHLVTHSSQFTMNVLFIPFEWPTQSAQGAINLLHFSHQICIEHNSKMTIFVCGTKTKHHKMLKCGVEHTIPLKSDGHKELC